MFVLWKGWSLHHGLSSSSAKRFGSPVRGGILVSRTSTTSPLHLQLQATLCWNSETLPVPALVDSGAEEYFLYSNLVQQLGIPSIPLDQPLIAQALNGVQLAQVTRKTSPIDLIIAGNHCEKVSFCVIDCSEPPVVLDYPWLTRHNPQLDWRKGENFVWSPNCHRSCLQSALTLAAVEAATPPDQVKLDSVPVQYHDLAPVFSKDRALSLPPRRSYDCAIELCQGATLSSSRLFNLSKPERTAIENYIHDSLAAGIIRPSSSPLGARFFFVDKKNKTLQPCIDFRGLNEITIKNSYPLPLINSAFSPLQGAQIFTKLDLRNAYHLIRIWEVDEWKTAFNTPLGHFEYLVMPFGLPNAPAVFQHLIDDVA
uniref:ribonuclease H n=1 Tax=Amphiprion ocellaris TaxID=80972 RepID=A0AAQ5YVE2_AMPOC